MQRIWRTLVPLGTSFVAAALTALLRRPDPETPLSSRQPALRERHTRGGRLRAAAVDFLSDVLAETYRKLRMGSPNERRRP